MTGPKSNQADVAIIIVSTSEAKWLEPCLSTVFAVVRSKQEQVGKPAC